MADIKKIQVNGTTYNLRDDSKQPTLVSGINIKTIHGQSVLGEGDIDIVGPEGPQGDDGLEGLSTYYCSNATPDTSLPVSSISVPTGRTLKIGDILITSKATAGLYAGMYFIHRIISFSSSGGMDYANTELLSSVADGAQGPKGDKGDKGDTGATGSVASFTTTGTGNAVTGLTLNSDKTVTVTKDSTFLTSHQDISGKANLSGGNTFNGEQIFNNNIKINTEGNPSLTIHDNDYGATAIIGIYSSGLSSTPVTYKFHPEYDIDIGNNLTITTKEWVTGQGYLTSDNFDVVDETLIIG